MFKGQTHLGLLLAPTKDHVGTKYYRYTRLAAATRWFLGEEKEIERGFVGK